ncbi:MAG: CopD family protein [Verrucomicrobia bacterium]|nr:CopD family protein [Verrucomicrobiota bacterium]
MTYIVVKAIHLVGVVCWFAGLFYIVRLFIYHTEALDEPSPKREILTDQFKIMARRLWLGITVPAMFLTAGSGAWLLTSHSIAQSPWLHFKLALLALLFAYHFHCGWIGQQLARDARPFTAKQLRAYNEVATVLLVGIVFAAVSKTVSVALWALGGLALLFVVLVVFLLKKLQGKS